MILTCDFETRSRIDLRTCGSYKYADDPSTQILMLALKPDAGTTVLWIPEWARIHLTDDFDLPMISTDEAKRLTASADVLSAHNATFERCLWKIMVERYGFADRRAPENWKDTAAMGAVMALPRALEDVTKALDLPHKKNSRGHRIMLKWCKPRKPTKNDPSEWCHDPAEFYELCDYCIADVDAEYGIDLALPNLSYIEQKLWILDQKINDFGIQVDLDAIDNLQAKVNAKNLWLIEEAADLKLKATVTKEKKVAGKGTGEFVTKTSLITSPKQTEKVIALINEHGYPTKTVDADFLKEFLNRDGIDPKLRRLLEIRKLINKTSIAKLGTMKKRAQADGRVRGSLIYHGASTGRWAAKGLQIQNFPRTKFKDDDIERVCKSSVFEVERNEGGVHDITSKCLRSVLIPKRGKIYTAMDFSNIEGRVAAWLAGEHWKVQAFEAYDAGTGPDLYKLSYSMSYGTPVDQVTDDQRQAGKTCELSLQYSGFTGALLGMAEKFGLILDEDTAKDLCMKWRGAHPNIKRAWYSLGDAAIKAVKTGKPVRWRSILLVVSKDFLRIRLPSGRPISYYKPSVQVKDHYGSPKEYIRYQGVHTYTRKWCETCGTHGGDIYQSIVQGTARDFLSEAMTRMDDAGFDIPFHVHDEAVNEGEEEREEEMKAIMSVVPEWGEGCPISVEGWSSTRYQK